MDPMILGLQFGCPKEDYDLLVQSILDKRKTMMLFPVTEGDPQPVSVGTAYFVREYFRFAKKDPQHPGVYYRASMSDGSMAGKWLSPEDMNVQDSRVTIEVISMERKDIQDLLEEELDAIFLGADIEERTSINDFRRWWDTQWGKTELRWDNDPQVYVATFKLVESGSVET